MGIGIANAVGFLKRTVKTAIIDPIAAAVNAFYAAYIARVTTDSGSVRSETNTKAIYRWFVENELIDHIKFLWFGEAGIKIVNPSDTLKRLSKGYSLDSVPNDWAQPTAGNQPYLGGDIAPTEKQCMSNPQGGDARAKFTNIEFAVDESWWITLVFNGEGNSDGPWENIIGDDSQTPYQIRTKNNPAYVIGIRNEVGSII